MIAFKTTSQIENRSNTGIGFNQKLPKE
uniref:Uncharacterized protein n=1 Tax=Moniliophthora roreri TaxID=221103 RepID=A0A0W0F7U5_MONRR